MAVLTFPRHSLIRAWLCRPPLPPSVTERFRARVPNSVFQSNPCRIKYCTQEIVVFREDIINKMRRNCIWAPADDQGTSIDVHVRWTGGAGWPGKPSTHLTHSFVTVGKDRPGPISPLSIALTCSPNLLGVRSCSSPLSFAGCSRPGGQTRWLSSGL